MTRHPLALLSDFGTQDWYVSALKGILLQRSPQSPVTDITHAVPAQDIFSGAFALAQAVPWFPAPTVFLAVVDPGVGSDRSILVVRSREHFFVGPDNGVLSLAINPQDASAIRADTARFPESCRTFQARDIMAPIAGAIASGKDWRSFGDTASNITSIELPKIKKQPNALIGEVLYIDRFGNAITNFSAQSHAKLIHTASFISVEEHPVCLATHYQETQTTEPLFLIGSCGLYELALPNHSVADEFALQPGSTVRVEFNPE